MLLHNQSLRIRSFNLLMSVQAPRLDSQHCTYSQTSGLKCWRGQRLQCRCTICQPLSFCAHPSHELLLPVLYSPALNHTAGLWITDLRRIPVLSSAKKIFTCWKSQTYSEGILHPEKEGFLRGCLIREAVVQLQYVNDSKWAVIAQIKMKNWERLIKNPVWC